MKMCKVYLAGGCKHEPDEGIVWRKKIINDWDDLGINFINPLKYFRYSESKHQSDKQVKEYYCSRIRTSDVVLVNLNNSDKSCGTCQEVQYAVDHDIPVIGFGRKNVYNWLLLDCQCVFDTPDDAMEYIYNYYVI